MATHDYEQMFLDTDEKCMELYAVYTNKLATTYPSLYRRLMVIDNEKLRILDILSDIPSVHFHFDPIPQEETYKQLYEHALQEKQENIQKLRTIVFDPREAYKQELKYRINRIKQYKKDLVNAICRLKLFHMYTGLQPEGY